MKGIVKVFLSLCFLLAALFSFSKVSFYSFEQNTVHTTFSEEDIEGGHRWVEERLQYELKMLRDPATGEIPKGIKKRELKLAKTLPKKEDMVLQKGTTLNTYTILGPGNIGGRTRAIAFDVRAPLIMLSGGVSSGIFRSTDGGASWTDVTPAHEIHNVTTIAQDPRSGFEDTWYYGTGESIGNSASGAGAFYRGQGIFKSADNGLTWSILAATSSVLESFDSPFDYITRVAVDPTSGDVYAACVGSINRSTDGGTSWSLVLGGTPGISSIFRTDVLVATTGAVYAAFSGDTPASSPGGTPPSTLLDGVWKSPTGDASSWTKIAGGPSPSSPPSWKPLGSYGRVVLALAPSDEDTLYVLYYNKHTNDCVLPAAPEADFFRFDAALTLGPGAWADLTPMLPAEPMCLPGNSPFACQGGYDLVVSVKPDDGAFVVIGGTNAYKSTDAGVTWERIGGYLDDMSYAKYPSHHPDIHALVFRTDDPEKMFSGTDGGIHVTDDITVSPVSWTSLNSAYYTLQYYYVALDPTGSSMKAIGGSQDNGTTYSTGSTTHSEVFGGDGVSVGISSGNTYHYLGFQLGAIKRRLPGDPPGVATDIKPTGAGSGLFVTYFLLDPDNTEALYYANSGDLYRTTSASTVTTGTWTLMTGIGGATTGDIRSLAVTRGSYTSGSKLYIGTDDGKIFRLDDPQGTGASTTPVDITDAGMPSGGNINWIAVDPSDDKKVMCVFSNYEVSSIWYTSDASVVSPTWSEVEGNISLPSIRSCQIVNRTTGTEYYVGTSVGLYSTTTLSGGSTVWALEGTGVIDYGVVSSMAYRPADNGFLLGTHGNGMFYTDVPDPLPVELTIFTASVIREGILLEWVTETEVNNYGFEVERQVRSKQLAAGNWEKITFLEGYGNSNSPKEYSFIDEGIRYGSFAYRLKQIDNDGTYEYSDVIEVNAGNIPDGFVLEQNYPNPFNPSTVIKFAIAETQKATLTVYDILGNEIAQLFNETSEAGKIYEIEFDAGGLSSGVYYYRLSTPPKSLVRKMLLLR